MINICQQQQKLARKKVKKFKDFDTKKQNKSSVSFTVFKNIFQSRNVINQAVFDPGKPHIFDKLCSIIISIPGQETAIILILG